MSYEHSSVYIVKIVDVMNDGETNTWYIGPYGNTRAEQAASAFEADAREYAAFESRQCTVEPLFCDDECLRVADYGRTTHGSLR